MSIIRVKPMKTKPKIPTTNKILPWQGSHKDMVCNRTERTIISGMIYKFVRNSTNLCHNFEKCLHLKHKMTIVCANVQSS